MAAADLAVRARARVPMLRPPAVLTRAAIADLRALPDPSSELVDRSHHGERLTVLGDRGAWLYVQGEDHYFGWIAAADTVADGTAVTGTLVAVLAAEVRPRPGVAPGGAYLPAGARVTVLRREGEWVECAAGWLPAAALVEADRLPHRPPAADDLIATALPFLGTPYLWGGTSGEGIDCSGLVQQVYRLNGVGLDRDADQQALAGRPVDTPAAGDLLFFGEPRVTHVALSLGGDEFIHAPLRGGFVERRRSGPDRTPIAVRRYLPDGG